MRRANRMKSPRTMLREELTARLLPELRARGFVGPSAISGNATLYDFKRPHGDSTQVFTVQLERHGLPRFIINLAVEPPIGFDALIRKGGAVLNGRVRPSPGVTTRTWFRTDPTLWQKIARGGNHKSVEAVASCLALLPEIDAWWEVQTSSKHITVDRTNFPGFTKEIPWPSSRT